MSNSDSAMKVQQLTEGKVIGYWDGRLNIFSF